MSGHQDWQKRLWLDGGSSGSPGLHWAFVVTTFKWHLFFLCGVLSSFGLTQQTILYLADLASGFCTCHSQITLAKTFTAASLKQTLQVELVPISSRHLCGLCVAGTEFVSWHNGNQAVYFEHVLNTCTGDNCNTCGSVLASLSARGQNYLWNIHMSHVFQTYSQHVHAISNILAVISHVWVDAKVYISTNKLIFLLLNEVKKSCCRYIKQLLVKASTCIANIREEEQLSARFRQRFRCVFNSTADIQNC